MIRIVIFIGLIVFAFNASASNIDMRELDRGVRSSQSRSIMFQRNGAEIAQEMEAKRIAAEEEARRKAEEERLRKEQQVFRPFNLFGNGYKISAIINGEMVSNKDLQERANLFSLTTGMPVNEKNKKMIASIENKKREREEGD